MSAIVAFWLGGAVASAMIFAAEAAADDDIGADLGEQAALLLSVIFSPIVATAFVIDVARGWRG